MLEKTTFRGVISRWWPVAAAIIAFLVVPYLGIALAFNFAFVRRWDRSVMVTLIATGGSGHLRLEPLPPCWRQRVQQRRMTLIRDGIRLIG